MLARYHYLLAALRITHEKNSRVRLGVLRHCHPQDSSWTLLTILADHVTGFTVLFRCLHFYFGFLISAGPRDGSPRTLSMPLLLSLLVDSGCCVGVTISCGKDVGDVGVAEREGPVVDQGQRSVRSSLCCISFVCHL